MDSTEIVEYFFDGKNKTLNKNYPKICTYIEKPIL